jgi:F1F0 ATPase subunit 2
VLVGLEVDEKRMTGHGILFGHFPPWSLALAHFGVGLGLGMLYFHGVWWNVRLLADGRGAGVAIALGLVRFALLAGVLWASSLEGAMPLLLTALGVLVARPIVKRMVGGTGS